MDIPKVDWNKIFEFAWRILVFIVAIGIIIVVSTNWNRWEDVYKRQLFNDGTIRDFQLRTPQWTIGKNFDGTGAFGPWLVTPDAAPPGAYGLRIQGRLNGQVMQDARTDQLIFSVPALIEMISVAMSLQRGDVIITGTPGGVGAARKRCV